MATSAKNNNNADNIGRQIHRLAKSAENRRFLHLLPQLQVDHAMPGEFGELLQRLDSAEQNAKR